MVHDKTNDIFIWAHMFLVIIIMGFLSSLYSEKVAKFAYYGELADFHDSSITVGDDIIALSDYIYVGIKPLINDTGSPTPGKLMVPKSMSVNNGPFSSTYDNCAFTFLHPFPLTGEKTDFTFTIIYTIVNDTGKSKGGISPSGYDTTEEVSFSVFIDPNADPLPENLFDVRRWNRQLKIYHNNVVINQIKETMDSLEIRFYGDTADIHYDYKNISIIVATGSLDSARDYETFQLSDNGLFFHHTFARESATFPIANDGILQHSPEDTVIVVFRNQNLLLDTLVIQLPMVSGSVQIERLLGSSLQPSPLVFTYFSEKRLLVCKNLPTQGIITFYKINGQTVMQQRLKKGQTNLVLPKFMKPAIYLVHLKYGEKIMQKRIMVR